ncbi:uncharacterized protein LOC129584242 [Paramacrobiotus metropolitanus]|uniref:uncharacterized protein LOC129584242 n=1 Tax=Paramacrobiotus metropolitanus TaxID=2943436 RepID=UPI0024460033|nr:uncharacterized protein LOC129584242 [Paramacrobiotus metropolitanus]
MTSTLTDLVAKMDGYVNSSTYKPSPNNRDVFDLLLPIIRESCKELSSLAGRVTILETENVKLKESLKVEREIRERTDADLQSAKETLRSLVEQMDTVHQTNVEELDRNMAKLKISNNESLDRLASLYEQAKADDVSMPQRTYAKATSSFSAPSHRKSVLIIRPKGHPNTDFSRTTTKEITDFSKALTTAIPNGAENANITGTRPASGRNSTLADRLIAHFRLDSHQPTPPPPALPEPQPQPALPTLSGLGLSKETIEALEEENITESHHLVLLTHAEVEQIVQKIGDRSRIKQFQASQQGSPTTTLKVTSHAGHKRNVLLDSGAKEVKAKKPRRSRSASRSSASESSRSSSSSSSSSASSTSSASSGKSDKILKSEARRLRRPHTHVFAQARLGANGKSKSKIGAFDINLDEFWAGSMETLKTLLQSSSPKHAKVALEYCSYLKNAEQIASAECHNYSSALTAQAKPFLDTLFRGEIAEGKISYSHSKPKRVHAIGAVQKADSEKFRPITDCSRPFSDSLNSYIFPGKFSLQSIDDALALSSYACHYALVDIKSAYRHVPVFPPHRQLQGFAWSFDEQPETYFIDNFLCFGLSIAPFIFFRLSSAVARFIRLKGYKIVCYLDDFLVIGETADLCTAALSCLITTLTDLGFAINWEKVISATTRIRFLGVTLDSVSLTIELPPEKLQNLRTETGVLLSRNKATKKELQQLVGRLNFAAKAIYGARPFARIFIDALKPLSRPNHRTRLTSSLKLELQWWHDVSLL